MKAYPNYKNSGVPWLEHVPEHWETIKTKHLFSERIQKGYPNEPLLAATQTKGVVPKSMYENKTVEALKDLHLLKLVKPGDFVISLRSFQGGIEYAYYRGIISPAYTVMTPNQRIIPEYYKYLAKSKDFISLLQTCVTGIREGQNINYDVLRKTPMPIPAQDEQKQISRYLDWQTSKINKFIKAKKKLIALLKEQKQNVINQAVTRGLDPNVKLKPSGVEWIEDIPEHWDARRLRTLAAVRASGVDKNTNEDEVPVMLCNNVDIYRNEHITPKIDFMKATASKHEIRNFELKAGDLVITKDSLNPEIIGVPSYVPEALPGVLCAYHLYLIRPFASAIESEFLLRAFSSSAVSRQFRVATNGVTIVGLPQGAVKATVIPLPPLEEQRAIIAHINEKCAEISQAISRAEREIELMREYRTRLISDVVTGQVDVRNMKCEGGSLNEDEFEDIEEVEEEIELPEGGEDDE